MTSTGGRIGSGVGGRGRGAQDGTALRGGGFEQRQVDLSTGGKARLHSGTMTAPQKDPN